MASGNSSDETVQLLLRLQMMQISRPRLRSPKLSTLPSCSSGSFLTFHATTCFWRNVSRKLGKQLSPALPCSKKDCSKPAQQCHAIRYTVAQVVPSQHLQHEYYELSTSESPVNFEKTVTRRAKFTLAVHKVAKPRSTHCFVIFVPNGRTRTASPTPSAEASSDRRKNVRRGQRCTLRNHRQCRFKSSQLSMV